MMASARRITSTGALVALAILAGSFGRAAADHGALPPIVRWSPLTIGVLAGVLALGAGWALVAIVMRLMNKTRQE